jgi:acyl carrier protein
MTREEIRAAVVAAIVSVVPEARPNEIQPAVPLRDQLDMDSMDFMNFVVELDERVGVAVPEGDYARLTSVDACVEYLNNVLARGRSAG